jgi:hypothetical protein
MGATIPEEPVGDDGHTVSGALPLAHQNAPGPSHCWCPALPDWVCQRAPEQSIDFPCG